MARPYAQEMGRLTQTLAWAGSAPIDDLVRAIDTAALGPLVAVGSGGSLSAAHFLAQTHQSLAGQLARSATPAELINEPPPCTASIWLLSAGGGNVDINAAFEHAVVREPRQLVVLCGRAQSPLSAAARHHAYSDLLLFEPPAGKDGFLATNSLFGFAALLTRSYLIATELSVGWDAVQRHIEQLLSAEDLARWADAAAPIWERSTTIVLHGPNARVGAIDLELKFTEAALGNLQYADWRNFAHGRHHWLAKRGEQSAIIALISDDDERLAERTLALIPDEVPIARIKLTGPPPAVALGALVASLRVTGWAGEARGIDPGQPGVPEFGRKLYSLRPVNSPKVRSGGAEIAAIERKAFASYATLANRGQLAFWQNAYKGFDSQLRKAAFVGTVLDYDGTIVDVRTRTLPPAEDIMQALIRLIENGLALAIATGRGKSVRKSLRDLLPEALWPSVTVGYYNGLEIAPLSDDDTPNTSAQPSRALAAVASRLRAQPEVCTVRRTHGSRASDYVGAEACLTRGPSLAARAAGYPVGGRQRLANREVELIRSTSSTPSARRALSSTPCGKVSAMARSCASATVAAGPAMTMNCWQSHFRLASMRSVSTPPPAGTSGQWGRAGRRCCSAI